ncbi:hypothetical protein [Pusillimonas sp.]|uniref:hypothetical protein n=1 Tax=Pusillimonas sp. TaxID=3040095 RepID=UPI0037C8A37A
MMIMPLDGWVLRRFPFLRCYCLAASAVIACLAVLRPGQSQAASLRISPIGLDLPATQRAASITLVNNGIEPVNLQLRVFSWSQTNDEDELVPASELGAP